MEKGKVGFENRGLVILLCVLVMAIVGLGIGIGVVVLNGKKKRSCRNRRWSGGGN